MEKEITVLSKSLHQRLFDSRNNEFPLTQDQFGAHFLGEMQKAENRERSFSPQFGVKVLDL